MKLYRAIVNNTHDHYDDPGFALYYQEHEVIRETPAFYIIKINGKEKRIGKKSGLMLVSKEFNFLLTKML